MTKEPGCRHWKKTEGQCSLSGHPPSPWGWLWDNSCREDQRETVSLKVEKAKLSQHELSQADAWAKPSTHMSEATNCCKPRTPSSVHACGAEIYTSCFPTAFIGCKRERCELVPSSHTLIKCRVSWATICNLTRNSGLTPRSSSTWPLPEQGWPFTIPSVSNWVFLLCLFWLCGPSAGRD